MLIPSLSPGPPVPVFPFIHFFLLFISSSWFLFLFFSWSPCNSNKEVKKKRKKSCVQDMINLSCCLFFFLPPVLVSKKGGKERVWRVCEDKDKKKRERAIETESLFFLGCVSALIKWRRVRRDSQEEKALLSRLAFSFPVSRKLQTKKIKVFRCWRRQSCS